MLSDTLVEYFISEHSGLREAKMTHATIDAHAMLVLTRSLPNRMGLMSILKKRGP